MATNNSSSSSSTRQQQQPEYPDQLVLKIIEYVAGSSVNPERMDSWLKLLPYASVSRKWRTLMDDMLYGTAIVEYPNALPRKWKTQVMMRLDSVKKSRFSGSKYWRDNVHYICDRQKCTTTTKLCTVLPYSNYKDALPISYILVLHHVFRNHSWPNITKLYLQEPDSPAPGVLSTDRGFAYVGEKESEGLHSWDVMDAWLQFLTRHLPDIKELRLPKLKNTNAYMEICYRNMVQGYIKQAVVVINPNVIEHFGEQHAEHLGHLELNIDPSIHFYYPKLGINAIRRLYLKNIPCTFSLWGMFARNMSTVEISNLEELKLTYKSPDPTANSLETQWDSKDSPHMRMFLPRLRILHIYNVPFNLRIGLPKMETPAIQDIRVSGALIKIEFLDFLDFSYALPKQVAVNITCVNAPGRRQFYTRTNNLFGTFKVAETMKLGMSGGSLLFMSIEKLEWFNLTCLFLWDTVRMTKLEPLIEHLPNLIRLHVGWVDPDVEMVEIMDQAQLSLKRGISLAPWNTRLHVLSGFGGTVDYVREISLFSVVYLAMRSLNLTQVHVFEEHRVAIEEALDTLALLYPHIAGIEVSSPSNFTEFLYTLE